MPEEAPRRRLAAILAADVVGYSQLMGVIEVGTLAALKAGSTGRRLQTGLSAKLRSSGGDAAQVTTEYHAKSLDCKRCGRRPAPILANAKRGRAQP